MVAIADVAGLRIRGRSSKVDRVEIIEPADAGVILADSGVIHDHAAHTPLGRIEGVVPAAIGPGDDDMRPMLVANKRAAGDRQDLYALVGIAHRLVLHAGCPTTAEPLTFRRPGQPFAPIIG